MRKVFVTAAAILSLGLSPALAGPAQNARITDSRYSADVSIFVTWRPSAPKVFIGDCIGSGPTVAIRFTDNRYEADIQAQITTSRQDADYVYCT